MVKRAFLHIGSGKTGTTSVQQTLGANRQLLEACGFTYPLLEKDHQHDFAASYISEQKRLPRGILSQFPAGSSAVQDLLRANRRKWLVLMQNARQLILSSEYFGQLLPKEISALRKDLEELGFGDFRILYYVRDPRSYYLSVVQQYLKAGHNFSNYRAFEYTFVEQIQRWSEAFPDAVCVRKFAPEALVGGDILRDVADQIDGFFGVGLPLEQIETVRVNESISVEGMALLQEYRKAIFGQEENRFHRSSNFLLQLLQNTRDKFDQTKPRLRPEIGNHILERHGEQLAWLSERYGLSFDSQGSSATEGAEAPPPPKAGSLRVAEIVADWDEERFAKFRMQILDLLVRRVVAGPRSARQVRGQSAQPSSKTVTVPR